MCTRCPESFSNLAAKTDISLRKAAIYNHRLIVLVIKHQKRGGNEKNLGEFKIITDWRFPHMWDCVKPPRDLTWWQIWTLQINEAAVNDWSHVY